MDTPNSKKILIVEDDLNLRSILFDKLNLEGFNVLTAENGVIGLKTAISEKPDLILLDNVMPEMDGITMAHKLREDSWGKHAKVILLTNSSESDIINNAIKEGVFEYIIKSDRKLEEIIAEIKQQLT